MEPRIETIAEKKLVGRKAQMSFSGYSPNILWQWFMPRRKAIRHIIGTDLYSLEVYPPDFFDSYSPKTLFTKWAAVEVLQLEEVPEGMEVLVVPAGCYAVFLHKGPASDAARTYDYIFRNWLPQSNYQLDHRPHFAVMGEKYKYDDPASEEEIWIPVQPR